MAENRLIGDYPVIGIRPIIDAEEVSLMFVVHLRNRQWGWQKRLQICSVII